MNKLLTSVGTLILLSFSFNTEATLANNSTLSINAGSCSSPQSSGFLAASFGSCFGLEVQFNSQTVTNITGHNGLILGTSQMPTGSHSGPPDLSENPDIDSPWAFFANTGMHATSSSVTIISDDGAGNVELDFSGWYITWNGITVPLGSGALAGPFARANALNLIDL